MAKYLKGANSLRRMLRRLPDDMRKELGGELEKIGNRLLGRAKAETPVRTGRLRSALRAKVLVKSLQLRLGLIGKAERRRLFYGYILEQGRAAKTVMIKRGPRAGRQMQISPISRERYNYVFGRREDFRRNELGKMRDALERVLGRVAKGVTLND